MLKNIIIAALLTLFIARFIELSRSGASPAPRRFRSYGKLYTTPSGEVNSLFLNALTQPHLLIAGATGSGKSVIINGLISTALYRLPGCQPDGVQFILIDPKRVELSMYRNLPHTIVYSSEPDTMLAALQTALNITENRYTQMQKQGVRKYTGGDIYVIIDELADLMTTQKAKVTPLIQRLAQIGRAANVHIIAATQCPKADVIPTKIACNFDARFGLRTRNAQDSRNITGLSGLESLPKYGKGFYMTPDEEKVYDIPLTPDTELERLVNWWSGSECRKALPAAV